LKFTFLVATKSSGMLNTLELVLLTFAVIGCKQKRTKRIRKIAFNSRFIIASHPYQISLACSTMQDDVSVVICLG
jgi:hypothetical protein